MQKEYNRKTRYPKNIYGVLKAYALLVALLTFLTLAANGLNLILPKIIASAIDSYTNGSFVINKVIIEFSMVIVGVFIFTYLQSLAQTYTSEMVARDMRKQFIDKISVQQYSYINKVTPDKLLTNLTSDVDAVKTFVSQALVSIISSVFLIVGAAYLF